jgi:hypothetical protein
MTVGRNMERSNISVANGRLGTLVTYGDLYNSSVNAAGLGRVLVRGRLHEDATDGDVDSLVGGSPFLVWTPGFRWLITPESGTITWQGVSMRSH